MSKRQWLCLLGVWIMIFLFLGVPSLWHKIIAVISGLILIFFSYNLPYEKRTVTEHPEKSSQSFAENASPVQSTQNNTSQNI